MIDKLTKEMRQAAQTAGIRAGGLPRDQIIRAGRGSSTPFIVKRGNTTMAMDRIVIKGAGRQQPEKHRRQISGTSWWSFTGLSGSGKSSLAFDTIYADGQRRYVESSPPTPAQFLGRWKSRTWTRSRGSPAISIDQKTTSKNPRSTVGTVTEITTTCACSGRASASHCPMCGKEIEQQTVDQIVDQVMACRRHRIQILAPVVRGTRETRPRNLRRPKVRLCPGAGGRDPSTTSPRRSSWRKTKAQHRGRGGPAGDPGGHPAPPDRQLETANGLSGGSWWWTWSSGTGICCLFPELRLRGLRHLHRGADPPDVLLQQPLRGLPTCTGLGIS